MGQTIEIKNTTRIGEMLVVDTDRSISGQNGKSIARTADLGEWDGKLEAGEFDIQLARRLFDSDPAIDHVHVLSNVASIQRDGGWDDESVAHATDVISGFFRIY